MIDPNELALDRYIAEMEKQDELDNAVDYLAEELDQAAFKAMRLVMQDSIYETTAADMVGALEINCDFFYDVAERLIKADKNKETK